MSIWFGGDYNPEQWPREVWDEDIRLMKRAGVNRVAVGIFAWAQLEPSPGEFDFDWLDDILDRLHRAGIGVFLATATASPPAWLIRLDPDVLPVTAEGVRLGPGSRQHYSPHSTTYRTHAVRLVRTLAERYGDHPAVVAWHVNNEYGCHVSRCYSEQGARAFRRWLERKYGSIDALNQAWGTTFWSQTYRSFDQIEPPRSAPTFLNPTQLLDFDRFSSDALLECYRAEVAVLREVTPGLPVSTNFMGAFKPLDYWTWAREVDFVCDDSYPDPADPTYPVRDAMVCDLMRSLRGGQPWILAESATSAVNWRERNVAKPAGAMRAKALQAIARGADGVMFFQWRQSVFGSEKFHSAMLPHAGATSRIYREVTALGAEVAALAPVSGSRVEADIAVVFDWDAWWAIEQPGNPAAISYLDNVLTWYAELYRRGLVVDFVRPTAELSSYRAVLVPHLFCASSEAEANLASYVEGGGELVVTYQSFILDQDLHVPREGYLGGLAPVLGVGIEEFAPAADPAAAICLESEVLGAGTATGWTEFVHCRGASVMARFAGGPADGWPAVTSHGWGRGSAWYVATQPAPGTMARLLDQLIGATPGQVDSERLERRGQVFTIEHPTVAGVGERSVASRPE